MGMRVLILGGGFAGISAVRELAKRKPRGLEADVVLIDQRDSSVFAPLLPDLISRPLRADHLLYPLKPMCESLGVEFVQAEVLQVDGGAREVVTTAGTYGGDCVIICLGCETDYHGSESARRGAVGLKRVTEARTIRTAALRALNDQNEPRTNVKPVHLLVVGGGYTGFEVANHLSLLRDAQRVPSDRLRLTILETSGKVLPGCSDRVRRKATAEAEKCGIAVRTNTTIGEFRDGTTAELTDGTRVSNAVVVWAAGVTPGQWAEGFDVPRRQGGRLAVDEYLRVPGSEGVFAAGDAAGATRRGSEEPLRMAVQFSLAGGSCAARNAVRWTQGKALEVFSPFDPGYVVPLGRGQAVGRVLGRELSGVVPYSLHYFMCVVRTWGRRNKRGLIADAARSMMWKE